MVSLVKIGDVRPSVTTVKHPTVFPGEVPAAVPNHVGIVSFVAAEETKGCLEATASGGVVLKEGAKVPLHNFYFFIMDIRCTFF